MPASPVTKLHATDQVAGTHLVQTLSWWLSGWVAEWLVGKTNLLRSLAPQKRTDVPRGKRGESWVLLAVLFLDSYTRHILTCLCLNTSSPLFAGAIITLVSDGATLESIHPDGLGPYGESETLCIVNTTLNVTLHTALMLINPCYMTRNRDSRSCSASPSALASVTRLREGRVCASCMCLENRRLSGGWVVVCRGQTYCDGFRRNGAVRSLDLVRDTYRLCPRQVWRISTWAAGAVLEHHGKAPPKIQRF